MWAGVEPVGGTPGGATPGEVSLGRVLAEAPHSLTCSGARGWTAPSVAFPQAGPRGHSLIPRVLGRPGGLWAVSSCEALYFADKVWLWGGRTEGAGVEVRAALPGGLPGAGQTA